MNNRLKFHSIDFYHINFEKNIQLCQKMVPFSLKDCFFSSSLIACQSEIIVVNVPFIKLVYTLLNDYTHQNSFRSDNLFQNAFNELYITAV